MNSIGLTDCSNKIKEECTSSWMEKKSSENPEKEESRIFLSNIWGTEKSHNKNAEWLKELRSERNEIKQGNIQITTKMITYVGTYIST